jgi:hypothetical protein
VLPLVFVITPVLAPIAKSVVSPPLHGPPEATSENIPPPAENVGRAGLIVAVAVPIVWPEDPVVKLQAEPHDIVSEAMV